jgi:hypothetical protein
MDVSLLEHTKEPKEDEKHVGWVADVAYCIPAVIDQVCEIDATHDWMVLGCGYVAAAFITEL